MTGDTRLLMGMPITIVLADKKATQEVLESAYEYLHLVDEQFSPFKKTSEVSKINRGDIVESSYSMEMKEVIALCRKTQDETYGYFNPWQGDHFDPSGVVKGWAIENTSQLLKHKGLTNFYVDAGGDISVSGNNEKKENWRVGVRNPFKTDEIIKILSLSNKGIATSGTYERGNHIYDPYGKNAMADIVSLTVIADTVLDADRIATGAFAMGRKGIEYLQEKEGYEGYLIDTDGVAYMTSGFGTYVIEEDKSKK